MRKQERVIPQRTPSRYRDLIDQLIKTMRHHPVMSRDQILTSVRIEELIKIDPVLAEVSALGWVTLLERSPKFEKGYERGADSKLILYFRLKKQGEGRF